MCSGIGTSPSAMDCKKVDFPEPFSPSRPYLPSVTITEYMLALTVDRS